MATGSLQAVQCNQVPHGLLYGPRQLHLRPEVVECKLCDACSSLTSAALAAGPSFERLQGMAIPGPGHLDAEVCLTELSPHQEL